jgi:hypothetical protein
MPKIALMCITFFALFLGCACAALARPLVLLPPQYNAQYPYPVVLLLPPMGATAEDVVDTFLAKDWEPTGNKQAIFEKWLRRFFASAQALQPQAFILVALDGQGNLAHGFETLLAQTEKNIAETMGTHLRRDTQ